MNSPRQHLGGRYLKHRRTQIAKFRNPKGAAVISRITAVAVEKLTLQDAIEAIGEAELIRCGFPPGEIETQGGSAVRRVIRFSGGEERF